APHIYTLSLHDALPIWQGQLNAARETLAAVGVTDVPMIGVAKGPDRDAGNETFYLTDKPAVKLPPRDPLLYFIQRLRDEAHRFRSEEHTSELQSRSDLV